VLTTILFGGTSRERLVSIATAQSLSTTLPQAELWFWAPDDKVYAADRNAVLGHDRPFELELPLPSVCLGTLDQALDLARDQERVLLIGTHGGASENGELQLLCELRGLAFTASGSLASNLAFDKIATKRFVALAGITAPANVSLADLDQAFAKYGKLVAKPARDGSSFGLMFVNSSQDLGAVREAARQVDYVIEPCIEGVEATCGVLQGADGALIGLPPVEIRPADGTFDYESKYLRKTTQEICPGNFSAQMTAMMQDIAIQAHRIVGAFGYSRSDFFVTANGPVFIEINTLPGMTASSLYPKELKAQGIELKDFLEGQIELAMQRAMRGD
jgi:D-alanine-D-alanine ligase